MGAPAPAFGLAPFAVLEISSSACKRGEIKTSPEYYSNRHAVFQSVRFSDFGVKPVN